MRALDRKIRAKQKRHSPEEIVAKRRQVDALTGQGKAIAEAIRAIALTERTSYRWNTEYGRLKLDQVRRLKEPENARLKKAVADLTIDKMILTEAIRGN